MNVSRDRILYFAYGSNMFSRRLAARLGEVEVLTVGTVAGYRLTFDKLSKDTSGKCDIEVSGNTSDLVYGVVYSFPIHRLPVLDEHEGAGEGYRRDRFYVSTPRGDMRTEVYRAMSKRPGLKPFDWYLKLVHAGAVEHGFPEEYIRRLAETPSRPDPDRERFQEHMSLITAPRHKC